MRPPYLPLADYSICRRGEALQRSAYFTNERNPALPGTRK